MKMEKCNSTQIAEYGYDPVTKILALRYAMGGVYHYKDVPPDIYTSLKAAQSVGRFVHQNVKSKFAFEKQ